MYNCRRTVSKHIFNFFFKNKEEIPQLFDISKETEYAFIYNPKKEENEKKKIAKIQLDRNQVHAKNLNKKKNGT